MIMPCSGDTQAADVRLHGTLAAAQKPENNA
jgi:hypothetical protein